VLSTPASPDVAVRSGITELLGDERPALLAHGTTGFAAAVRSWIRCGSARVLPPGDGTGGFVNRCSTNPMIPPKEPPCHPLI